MENETLGEDTGDGRAMIYDFRDDSASADPPMELVLGKTPRETFEDDHVSETATAAMKAAHVPCHS